jgi:PAS domain S-box-containing protein
MNWVALIVGSALVAAGILLWRALRMEQERSRQIAAGHKETERELQDSRQQLGLLSSIASRTSVGMLPREVIQVILEQLAAIFPGRRVRYGTLSKSGVLHIDQSIEPSLSGGSPAEPTQVPPLHAIACDLSAAMEYWQEIRTGKPVAITDVTKDPRLAPLASFFEAGAIRSSLCHAIVTHNKGGQPQDVAGVLAIDAFEPRAWTQHEAAILTQACEYLAIAAPGARSAQERLHIEEQLRFSENRLRLITENMPALVIAINSLGRIVFWNKEAQRVTGYSPEELVGNPHGLEKLLPDPSYRNAVMAVWSSPLTTSNGVSGVRDLEFSVACKDGSERTISWSSIAQQVKVPGWQNWGIALDVTDRRAAEERVRQSEEKYRLLFENSPQPMWVYDNATLRFLAVNGAAVQEYGYSRDEFLAMSIKDIRPPEDIEALVRATAQPAVRLVSGPWRHRKKTGQVVDVEVSSHQVPFIAKDARLVIVTDVTERIKSLAALRESRALLEQAQAVAHLGSWFSEPGSTGRVIWSRETCRIYGMPDNQDNFSISADDFFARVYHADREAVQEAALKAFDGMAPFSIDHRITRPDGTIRWIHEQAEIERNPSGEPVRMLGVVQDITDRKLVEYEMAQRAQELARSNAELERFAYVASHDLQEPLRMVTSFTQLLAQRYKGRLDADADEFIGYAVEGATRMQRLIEDLLAYSRVGSAQRRPGRIKADAALNRAVANLRAAIQDSEAQVTAEPLPEVTADEAQLSMVFQNLVGNAIKFRSGPGPKIQVRSERQPGFWQFAVQDNGIGIDEKHRERIFTMFQRLHPRSVYPGNGIGLAICKRIVEGHGGRIWVESAPGQGSTFYFTLPEEQQRDEHRAP